MARNNREVAHLWAHGRAASGSNFYADSDTLYSYGYHFRVARRGMRNGQRFFFFNPATYRPTTSKHQSYALRAIHGLGPMFSLPPDLWAQAERGTWGEVLAWFQGRADDALPSPSRKPSPATAAKCLRELGEIRRQWVELHAFFGFRCSVDRLKTTERADQLQSVAQAHAADLNKAARLRQQREKRERARRKREALAAVDDWRKGEARHGAVADLGYPILRVCPTDPARVETSYGAQVLADTARRGYLALRIMRERGKHGAVPESMNGYGEPHWDGKSVRVGCHTFPVSEIETFAGLQNW